MAWEIVSSYPVPTNNGMSKMELSFKGSTGYLEIKRYGAMGGTNTSGLGQGSHVVNYINYYNFNLYRYRIYIAERMNETLIELTSIPVDGIFHAANIASPIVTNTLIVARELLNEPPTISGTDRNLGNYASPFFTSITVNDKNTSDSLSVKVTLNGTEIMNISGAPRNQTLTIDITKLRFDALAVGSTNTIQIVVNDGNGGIAYRTLTFVKTNTAPVITGSNSSLGTIESAPTYKYTVTDAEGDAITIIERVNDMVIRTFSAVANTEYTFNLSAEEWLQLWPNTAYAIYIEATDARGAKSVRSMSFQRKTIKSVITLKNPFETDIHANRIMLNPTVTIPDGAKFKAEACNNAFDDVPTWEDITERALSGKGYIFTFDVKTAVEWGVDLRLTLERGTATSPIILDGFGGAFD